MEELEPRRAMFWSRTWAGIALYNVRRLRLRGDGQACADGRETTGLRGVIGWAEGGEGASETGMGYQVGRKLGMPIWGGRGGALRPGTRRAEAMAEEE
eukprot:6175279-Pleurochrysis_carterae.AAC.2